MVEEDREQLNRVARDLYRANLSQFNLVTKNLKAICDLLVSMNLPGMDLPKHLTGRKLDNGIVGVAGAISALVVVFNNWPKNVFDPSKSIKIA